MTGLILTILLLFGTLTAVLHLLGRRDWTRREKALTAELAQTHARLDRANLFLSTEPQIVIAWGAADSEPDIEGDYSLVTDAPLPRRVLGFAPGWRLTSRRRWIRRSSGCANAARVFRSRSPARAGAISRSKGAPSPAAR